MYHLGTGLERWKMPRRKSSPNKGPRQRMADKYDKIVVRIITIMANIPDIVLCALDVWSHSILIIY